MQIDDLVIYTQGHYDVLVSYALVREETARRTDILGRVIYDKVDRRKQIVGRVLEVGEGFVRVLWLGADKISCHFPDNLQVLRRRV